MKDIDTMIREDFPHVNAIRVVREGKVLLRQDYNGHKENELHRTGCIFKSVVSAIVGNALKDEVLDTLDSKLIDYYPKYINTDIDKNFLQLTLRDIMTKKSGILWPGPNERLPKNIKEVFLLTFKDSPGTTFEYKPDPQIMSYLIEEITHTSFIEYTDVKLFREIGINDWEWRREDIEGLMLSVDGLGRFADLFLCKGNYKGKSVFTETFYRESTSPHSEGGFPERRKYGYYWWIDQYMGVDYYFASGFGGQMVCVLPDLNASIVIVSDMDRPHPENHAIVRNTISSLLCND
jgi:CubicO group peptidase (beta-lactamase class C family)